MNKESVPFREGVFATEGGKNLLIASRCQACGQLFFPSRPYCFDCFSQKMETVYVGNRGKLHSFTTAYMPILHFDPPYTAGWIDLEEGLRIFAPINAAEDKRLEIGMDMELIIDELWQEGDRGFVGFKYSPLG